MAILKYLTIAAPLVAALQPEAEVTKLTKDNFSDVVGKNRFVLIKWFAPWCGHCKSMAEDYEKAARVVHTDMELQKEGQEVVVGEVDATVEHDLASTYEVQGYPTLHWFVAGSKRLDYSGPRTSEGIVNWIKENVGPALKQGSQSDLDNAIAARKYGNAIVSIMGPKSDADFTKTAGLVADLPLIAVQTYFIEAATKSVTIYRGTSEVKKLEGDSYSFETVEQFVKDERRPLFGQINEDNFEMYMEAAKNGLFWVCIDPKEIDISLEKYSSAISSAAEAQTKKGGEEAYPFVWLDVSEFEEHAKQELGCTTYPTIVLQRGDLLGERGDAKVDKFVRSFSDAPATLNEKGIEEFFADIKSGKLEATPEPDELDDMDDGEGADAEGDDDKKDEEL